MNGFQVVPSKCFRQLICRGKKHIYQKYLGDGYVADLLRNTEWHQIQFRQTCSNSRKACFNRIYNNIARGLYVSIIVTCTVQLFVGTTSKSIVLPTTLNAKSETCNTFSTFRCFVAQEPAPWRLCMLKHTAPGSHALFTADQCWGNEGTAAIQKGNFYPEDNVCRANNTLIPWCDDAKHTLRLNQSTFIIHFSYHFKNKLRRKRVSLIQRNDLVNVDCFIISVYTIT